jgi:DNA-binding transcriptional ArsR family regulator
MIHIPGARLDPGRIQSQAELFALLGSPARIALICSLAEGEKSVGELVAVLAGLDCDCSMERTNVSKHLGLLREAGILSCSGEAQKRIYRLETPCILEAIDCVLDRGCAASSMKS